MSRPVTRTALAAFLLSLVATVAPTVATAPAHAANPATPGNFTGYGFDQCLAPTQGAMNTWLKSSPFLSVGIYISGDSRGCRSQPNLTKRWVAAQLRKGWRLLPITLGPQASCSPHFPRYGNDETITPTRGSNGRYTAARRQGTAEAVKTVGAARALGIVEGSTLWYDLEAFDHTRRDCRESALAFLHAWTRKLHGLDYVSGVYSSAGSGIKMLDDVRVNRPGAFTLPDRIWIARWDGKANTSTSYIRRDGWRPGGRVKQYLGGHNETWGGVTINIDRNYLDIGKGSTAAAEPSHCNGTQIGFRTYRALARGTESTGQVKALQCLLKEQGLYTGKINGVYGNATVNAANAWQARRQMPERERWTRPHWMSILAAGRTPVLKFGSAGPEVRRVQRALNAVSDEPRLKITGVVGKPTDAAIRAYQRRIGVKVSGVVVGDTLRGLRFGER